MVETETHYTPATRAPKASIGTKSRRDETIRHPDQDEGGNPLLAAGIAAVVGGDPLAAGVAAAISWQYALGSRCWCGPQHRA